MNVKRPLTIILLVFVAASAASMVLNEDAAPTAAGVCPCGSGKPAPEGVLRVNGRDVVIPGLPLLFEQQARRGLEPGDSSGDQLVAAVRIYHPISTEEQSSYRVALVGAYQLFHRRRTAVDSRS